MLITSLENNLIKDIMKLHQRKYRKKLGKYIVEGEHLVLEAIKSGNLETLILEQDTLFPVEMEAVYVTNDILNKISTLEVPSKVMGICKINEEETYGKKILLLDEIQDPGNLGTIIRSAKAFDIDTIVLGTGCVDLYNSKTLRGAQGMHFHLSIFSKDLGVVIPKLKDRGTVIYATNVKYGSDVRTLKKKDKEEFALILGNEGAGVNDEYMSLADQYIYIPMNKDVESLNVAVAGSILMYELKGDE